MSDGTPDLSVVIPAYNEEHRLGRTLEAIHAWLSARGRSFEILVVDDGSRDGTVDLARRTGRSHPEVKVVQLPANTGKGAAVREGFRRSRGRRVLFSDADLSTPIEELEPMEAEMDRGTGMVLASRGLRQSRLPVRQAWYREGMGKLFNRIVRLLSGIPFRDTQCGFKLLGGDDARALSGRMREDGFAFDVELILLARAAGLTVTEVPVTWRHVDESRVSPMADAVRMLVAVPRIVARAGRYRG